MMNVASVTTNIIARAVDGQSRLSLFIAHMATNVQLPMVGVNNKKGAGRQTQYSYSIPNKCIDGHYDDDAADHRLRKHRQSNCQQKRKRSSLALNRVHGSMYPNPGIHLCCVCRCVDIARYEIVYTSKYTNPHIYIYILSSSVLSPPYVSIYVRVCFMPHP